MTDFWTSDRIQTLKEGWLANRSMGVIAAQLGVTRSTVSGKIDRLGLPKKGAVIAKAKSSTSHLVLAKNVKQVHGLRRNACRWIDGSVYTEDFHYCRAPKQSGSSYCPKHHRMVWTVPPRR